MLLRHIITKKIIRPRYKISDKLQDLINKIARKTTVL